MVLYDPHMPYLTLWDKISQNLAYMEANSQKIFKISQKFQTILQHILLRNKHKSHFVVFITSLPHLNKGFWLFWRSSKVILVKISQNFIKSHLKIGLNSQISVHSLWHSLFCLFESHLGTYYYKHTHVYTYLKTYQAILYRITWDYHSNIHI